jgi:O-antigen/teichoic acid export membrane protein
MVQYWFQYKLQSKYASVTMLIAYAVVSAYKIYLLATQKSVYWFAVSHSVEFGIIGIVLILIYLKKSGQRFRFSGDRARKMLSRSKHYILAALMIVVIQNTDHIMITAMKGTAENGFYSAAITCVSILQFVFVAIVDSFRPVILAEKKENSPNYRKNVARVYGLTLYLSLAQCIAFFVLAKLIIAILYGSDYAGAVPVLRALVFYFVFSVMGLVRNVWILAEEKQKYLWIINLSGALFNVILNAILIPFWGAVGAATASLLTQLFANFVLGFIMKPLRGNNRLMLQGLNPKFFFPELKGMLKELRSK